MRLFRLWTRDEIVGAIRSLEEALASGATTISYTGGGTVTQTSSGDMTRTLQSLYERLDQLDGVKPAPRIRHIRVQTSKGL